ncbi:MAG: hypothetical protein NC123_09675 [Butyrivibrio sp.]|nr:hypothetical protein [Acetatifactor muris]MCM1559803.1 hypothetical protein [Butyrivibrio sp.]
MKKVCAVMMTVLIFSLSACMSKEDTDTSSNTGIQLVFDKSVEASAFTDSLLEEMLNQKGITDYNIKLTSGGFITDDPIIYIVGYRFTYDGTTEVYGYKLSLAEGGYAVLEEGREIGAFIVGDGE